MRSETGFTLIEILIALLVLGVGLIATMAYMPAGLVASRKAADINKAAMLARGVFAEVKAVSETSISSADALDTAGVFTAAADYPGYAYSVDVNPKNAAQLKTITVTVQWTFKGKFQTDTYQTQIVKYNPT